MRIFINPGHSDTDPGAVNPRTGLKESDVALDISQKLETYLNAVGYTCKVLRSDSLSQISDTANAWPADLFISVHCNSFYDEQANGVETLFHPASSQGRLLASYIQYQLIDSTTMADRGLKERPGLGVLRLTDMPAVLVECGFISNDEGDYKILNNENGRREIAAAIARGVSDYVSTL